MTRRLPARSRLSRPQWTLTIGAALAAIGFLAAAQWNSSFARQEFTTSAQRVLTAQAERLQATQERLRNDLGAAEERVRAFEEAGQGSGTIREQVNQELAAARLAAGLTDVRGPGMVLEIADSLRPVPEGESANNYIVLVDDLRDLVNALWASGADAITVGGLTEGIPPERLVATSSIYGIGTSIVVNTAYLSPPFRIEAVGPDGLHDRFLAHPIYLARVAQRIEGFGLQFASEANDDLTLEGFIGNTRMRYGAPVAEGE